MPHSRLDPDINSFESTFLLLMLSGANSNIGVPVANFCVNPDAGNLRA